MRIQRPRSRRGGFTLVDVCVAIFILAVALGTLVGTIFYALRLEQVNAESAAASQLARAILEDVNALDFGEVFSAYNDTKLDDPDPKVDRIVELQNSIEQSHLLPDSGAQPPRVTMLFPVDKAGQLREDVVNPLLGMPRDLNGDGDEDAKNHAADYTLLPMMLRITWDGAGGERTFEMSTLLRAR